MSVVTKDESGTYVQVSRKLRINRGPGKADLVSARPIDQQTKRFTDDPATAPTLIVLTKGDLADVPSLLALGAILPYEAPPTPEAFVPRESHPMLEKGGG